MARPQTATDDEILQAAHLVIERRGHEGFTLSEVAEEVGLSRAAITLRFKSALALKCRLLEQNIVRFITLLNTLPKEPSGDNLIEIAAFLGRVIGKRDNYSTFLSVYSGNMKVEQLAELERKRGIALREIIARCMPPIALTPDQAVLAFQAHLTGSMMAWQGDGSGDPCTFLVERTKQWLTLARIPFSQIYNGIWMNVLSAPVETAPARPRARRPRRSP